MNKVQAYTKIIFFTDESAKWLISNDPMAIIRCIEVCKPKTAMRLLTLHQDFAACIIDGTSPLTEAVRCKYTVLANSLIDTNKASIDYVDKHNKSAIKYVIKNKMGLVLDKLIEHKAVFDMDDIFALFKTLPEKLLVPIINKPYIYATIKKNYLQMIHYAIKNNVILDKLIRICGDKLDVLYKGKTLIAHAIESVSESRVGDSPNSGISHIKLLLKAGAHIDYIDGNNDTYLTLICKIYSDEVHKNYSNDRSSNLGQIIDVLLSPEYIDKYDVTHINKDGLTALHYLSMSTVLWSNMFRTVHYPSVSNRTLELFKLVCEKDKRESHQAFRNLVGNRDAIMCLKFIDCYNFDPYYVINGQTICAYVIEKELYDVSMKLTGDTHIMKIVADKKDREREEELLRGRMTII